MTKRPLAEAHNRHRSEQPGRFERVDNSLGFHVYVDYAHPDAALRSILEAARELGIPLQ